MCCNNLSADVHRTGDVAEAVNFARVTMAPLRGLLSHRSLAYDEMLRDVIALLAYPRPEVLNTTRCTVFVP